MKKEISGYKLTRRWFDFAFEKNEAKPIHTAIYLYAVDLNNKLNWKKDFQIATDFAMETLGIKSSNTYLKAFNELVDWGLIELVKKSTNQWTANRISLYTADLNFELASEQQEDSTVVSTDSIDKPKKPNKPNKQRPKYFFDFLDSLVGIGADKKLAKDWIAVRKTKKATNTETAFNLFAGKVKKSKLDINQVLELCIDKSWSGFEPSWANNLPKEKDEKALW